LVEAVLEGDSNYKMTELLFSSGASIEWHEGEALEFATKSASFQTMALLLAASPSQTVLRRAFRTAITLARDQRHTAVEMIMKAGKAVDKHTSKLLHQATTDIPADHLMIKMLLDSEIYDEGESAVHAATALDLDTLILLLETPRAKPFVSSVFQKFMATDSPWQSSKGLAITSLILDKGASGEAVDEAFAIAIEKQEVAGTLAADFLNLLLPFADVNYSQGLTLQRAAQQGNLSLIQNLLPKANPTTISMAFPYLFMSSSGKDELSMLQMIDTFTEAQTGLEDFKHPDPSLEPVLFMALKQFPRKTTILKGLLDAGFSPHQWMMWEMDHEFGKEECSILCWALCQPQKKISSANIELLINAGGE
jgi:hypothetical protein